MDGREQAAREIMTAIGVWAQAGTPQVPPMAPVGVADIIRLNRMDSLAFVLYAGPEQVAVPAPWADEWQAAYRRCLLHGVRHLQAGLAVASELERAGIPCLLTRGPFAGVELYGDIGTRYFSDVDILVPRRAKRSAWAAVNSLGYRLKGSAVSRGMYDRHHLAWPMVNNERGIHLDLHWAVDHPYKLLRVDYQAVFDRAVPVSHPEGRWLQPCPLHLVLLTCLHLEKECRTGTVGRASTELVCADLLRGRGGPWVDALLAMRRYGADLEWDDLMRTAQQWGAAVSVQRILSALFAWLGDPVPEAVRGWSVEVAGERAVPRWVRALVATRVARRAASMLRFRGECVSDLYSYVLPPAGYFGKGSPLVRVARRAAHTGEALLRLLVALADGFACALVSGVRCFVPRRSGCGR